MILQGRVGRQTRKVKQDSGAAGPLLENSACLSPQPPLVFLHIPKCGGTSIETALRRCFRLAGNPHVNPVASRYAAQIAMERPTNEAFFARYPLFQQFLLLFLLADGKDLISGHLPISHSILDEFGRSHCFAVVLRDPVERWLSHYIFNKLQNTDPQVPPCANSGVDEAEELKATLASWRGWHLAHIYTIMLSGSCPDVSAVDAAVIQAMANLERIRLVGVIERLPEFGRAFAARYHRKLVIPRMNAARTVAGAEKHLQRLRRLFTPTVRATIRHLCCDDYRIYERAQQLVDARSRDLKARG
jgi:hypothetical protein